MSSIARMREAKWVVLLLGLAVGACSPPAMMPEDTGVASDSESRADAIEDGSPSMDVEAPDASSDDVHAADSAPDAVADSAPDASAGMCNGDVDCTVFCGRIAERCAGGATCMVAGANQCPRWTDRCETICGVSVNVQQESDMIRAVLATSSCAAADARYQSCRTFNDRCPEPNETTCAERCGNIDRTICAMGAMCNVAVAPNPPMDFCAVSGCQTACMLMSGVGGREQALWECAARATTCSELNLCASRCAR